MTHHFSETFIAMAKAAEEIQALRPEVPDSTKPCPDVGSFFLGDEYLETLHWDNDEGRWIIGGYAGDDSEWPWLPRLDQLLGMLGAFNPDFLQRMVPVEWAGAKRHFEGMDEAYKPASQWADYLRTFKSYEELALAYVMQVKYGKRWDGKAWMK